ncbi:MAG: hypothetical protein M3Q44_08110 [bacterium]|nr:hypothetical protein [bacterium]
MSKLVESNSLVEATGIIFRDDRGERIPVMRDPNYNFTVGGRPISEVAPNYPETTESLIEIDVLKEAIADRRRVLQSSSTTELVS